MERSNLRLRSNVYLRQPEITLKEDRRFIRHLRGRAAIRKLLDKLGVQLANQRHNDPLISQLVDEGTLTIAQKNALKWELPCAACNSIPCGLNFKGGMEFRCSVLHCSAVEATASPLVSKLVAVPIAVLQQAKQIDPNEALSWAIEQRRGQPPPVGPLLSPATIPLKVSSAVDSQYTETELAAFLIYGLRHYSAR